MRQQLHPLLLLAVTWTWTLILTQATVSESMKNPILEQKRQNQRQQEHTKALQKLQEAQMFINPKDLPSPMSRMTGNNNHNNKNNQNSNNNNMGHPQPQQRTTPAQSVNHNSNSNNNHNNMNNNNRHNNNNPNNMVQHQRTTQASSASHNNNNNHNSNKHNNQNSNISNYKKAGSGNGAQQGAGTDGGYNRNEMHQGGHGAWSPSRWNQTPKQKNSLSQNQQTSSGNTEVCGGGSYSVRDHICCQNTLHKRQGVRPACCGNMTFDFIFSFCCNGKVQPRTSDQMDC